MTRRYVLCVATVVALAAGISPAADAPNADVARDTIVGQFALWVRAALVRPPTADALSATRQVVRFAGRGRANAQRSVVIRIGPLDSPSGQAEAKVELEPLRRYGQSGNCFRGRGVAVVVDGPRTYKFPLAVNGRMVRTSNGETIMRGHFRAITRSNRPPWFAGMFCGPMVRATAASIRGG